MGKNSKEVFIMAKKQFKTESKKLLDMMINSIYTHKEIFLRELISNASDAIDKLYFRSLTDDSVTLSHGDFEIRLTPDKTERTLKISDNGCGMTKDELENNLGTIARSGSLDFKKAAADNEAAAQVDVIGQFGVGFYSAFMVAKKIVVESKAFGADEAWRWESSGADGYTVTPCEKANAGTEITLWLKDDAEEENYSDFLSEYRLKSLVKRYSDYIRYPIRMQTQHEIPKEGTGEEEKTEYETVTEDETLNSMVPIWKKGPSEVEEGEYDAFYKEKFYDYEAPLKVIRQKAEGTSNYISLLFIPSHAPFDYYSKDYEKGLQLYSSGVLIMDKCKDLLPDHFSFVKGLVDSSDLSLNISREMLQHDRQLKIIAKALEKKIGTELKKLLANERETYEKFWAAFGNQLKWGCYVSYGMNKEALQDLLLFKSAKEKKLVTLEEYLKAMRAEQKAVYYATGETETQIERLPQVEAVLAKGCDVLLLTADIDEFALQMLREYGEKSFVNVCKEDVDLSTEDEKKALEALNEEKKDLLDYLTETLSDEVTKVRFTSGLEKHAVCLSSEGMLSLGMERVLNKLPGSENNQVKAELVLEINKDHAIVGKLETLFAEDKEKLASYAKLLLIQAQLVSGVPVKDPAEAGELISSLML